MKTVGLYLAWLLVLTHCLSSNGQQCVDEDGTAVDWLVIYKLPREASGGKHVPRGIVADGKVNCLMLLMPKSLNFMGFFS